MFIIGKVLKPQGIQGEVKVEIITSFPEHFEHLSEIYIEQNKFVKLDIENRRFSKGFVFIKFKEIKSRNDAETLREKYLYVPDEELYPLKDDEFYKVFFLFQLLQSAIPCLWELHDPGYHIVLFYRYCNGETIT